MGERGPTVRTRAALLGKLEFHFPIRLPHFVCSAKATSCCLATQRKDVKCWVASTYCSDCSKEHVIDGTLPIPHRLEIKVRNDKGQFYYKMQYVFWGKRRFGSWYFYGNCRHSKEQGTVNKTVVWCTGNHGPLLAVFAFRHDEGFPPICLVEEGWLLMPTSSRDLSHIFFTSE